MSYNLNNVLQRVGWSRSRTLSVSYPAGTASPLEPRASTSQVRIVISFFFLCVCLYETVYLFNLIFFLIFQITQICTLFVLFFFSYVCIL